MSATQRYRITVGSAGSESEAERQRLTAELEQRLVGAGLPAEAITRESERPGQTMAAGTILSIETAERALGKLLDAVRSWLASRRTELDLRLPDGRKIKISAANFEEAVQLLGRTAGM